MFFSIIPNEVSPEVLTELEKLKTLDPYWYNTLKPKLKAQGSIDLHCWMRKQTTNEIIDPTPIPECIMSVILLSNSCSSNERHYEEIQNVEVKKIIHKMVFLMYVKDKLDDLCKYDETPAFASCVLNCFSKKYRNAKFKDYEICYGKMGFPKADGSIHWEYG